MKKIELMTKADILSDAVFKELLAQKDPIKQIRCEMELADRAQELKVAKEFDKLLKAYKVSDKKQPMSSDRSVISASNNDMRNQFHKFKEGKPTGIIDRALADYIIKSNYLFIMGGIPYIYQHGAYMADENETKLKAIIQKLIYPDIITIDIVNRVYRLILAEEKLQRKFDKLNQYPKHWINFKNGMLDVDNWKIEPHKPEYLSINQIPHDFNMDAEPVGENVKKFIEYALPNEADREMLYQYFGLCMTVDGSIQKFMVFCGRGGTGKSVLIRIIEKIVGTSNISNVSLQQLNERFFPSSLLGKTLNSCADIPSRAMEAVDGIKKATGEDMLIYERKGKDAYSFKSYAKLLFSANEIPVNIEEKSEAIYRRMMIIRIDHKPEKPDPNLWNKIEPELDYVMLQSVKALKRLYENGAIQESTNSKDNVLELYEQADNVLAFINDCLVKDTVKRVKQSELYKSYTDYCNTTGRNPVTVFGFNKNLRNKGFSTVQVHGNTHYAGLGFKEETKFMKVNPDDDVPFK